MWELVIIPTILLLYSFFFNEINLKKSVVFRFTLQFLRYSLSIQFFVTNNKITEEERTVAMKELARVIAYDIIHNPSYPIVSTKISDYHYDLGIFRDMIIKEYINLISGDEGNIWPMSKEDLEVLNKTIDKWIIKKNK